jgi:predicted dehydrogenase
MFPTTMPTSRLTDPMHAPPLRWGVLGTGWIAERFTAALKRSTRQRAVAVGSRTADSARKLADRVGIARAHGSYAELVADREVDVVYVATPHNHHRMHALLALDAGKHVLVEKPLAASVAEAEDLVARVDRSGRVLQVGAMKRHDPGLRYARDFIAGRMGRARSFTAWYRIGDLRPGIEHTLFPPVFADPAAGAAAAVAKADRRRYLLVTHGSHVFDTVRFLLGDVTEVTGRHAGWGRDHVWQLVLTCASGAVGTVALTVDVPGLPSEGIEVAGERGTVRVDTPFPFYRLASAVQAYASGEVVSPVRPEGDAYERQLEAFARTVRTGGRPDPDVRDGLEAIRLIEAAAEAVA